jgi:hypothetical protein
MKLRWAALLAIAAFAAGAGGASWFWLDFNAQIYVQFAHDNHVLRTQTDIVTKVAALEHIRAGRISDATRLLETLLDGDLMEAGALARGGVKFSANTGRAVERELQARKISGYAPADETVRSAVQEAFRVVPAASHGTAEPVTLPEQPRQAVPAQ